MNSIAVVDYGVNNIGSVVNMLTRLDANVVAAREPAALESASAILLPGIGAFDAGVRNLRDTGFFDAIKHAVTVLQKPILGICLGMQLLTQGSEEGTLQGLGLVPAFTRRFSFPKEARAPRVPHMGWNDTDCFDQDLFAGFVDAAPADAPRFYYVHSFQVVCEDASHVAARCQYGVPFTAAIRRDKIFGTQFHPEKSHKFGMRVLRNFVVIANASSGAGVSQSTGQATHA